MTKEANVDSSVKHNPNAKKDTDNTLWKNLHLKYDSVENFKKLTFGEQLARLYKYYEQRKFKYLNQRSALESQDLDETELKTAIMDIELEEIKNRKFFLRALVRYDLVEVWVADGRLD